jgi:hypothetical protein
MQVFLVFKVYFFMILSSIPHDIKTKSGLTNLANKEVVSVQSMERPVGFFNNGNIGKDLVTILNGRKVKTSISGKKESATHSGVVVTTKDGGKYLVHTGSKFGKQAQTVVLNAKNMGPSWKNVGKSKDVKGKTVGDFVKAGGKSYNIRTNNCHNAHDRMKAVGKRSPC